MPKARIKTLISQAEESLINTNQASEEDLALLKQIEMNVDAHFQMNGENTDLLETPTQVETEFAVRHPTIDQCLKDIIEVLGKMGI